MNANSPATFELDERVIDHVGQIETRRDPNVSSGEKLAQCQRTAWTFWRHELRVEYAKVRLRTDLAPFVVRGAGKRRTDHDIELAGIERAKIFRRGQRSDRERDPWSFGREVLDQHRQHRNLEARRHPESEPVLFACGVESLFDEEGSRNAYQHLSHSLGERVRPGSRLDASWAAREELIAEEPAKTVQSVAHGRLLDADPRSRPCDVPLGHQRVEGHEEVQIEGGKLGVIDGWRGQSCHFPCDIVHGLTECHTLRVISTTGRSLAPFSLVERFRARSKEHGAAG
ncbi:hypothetical protein LZC94_37915 [Pendulispora albinea]|uniref:Uncharacterized protein n=1 Tax=Pendulispora albinea TaxID=2741071 RepID=A0ABZ2LX60_9BACT